MSDTPDQDLSTGEYVYDPPYNEMRLRILLTGTASPDDRTWADALRKLNAHLEKHPLGITVRAELPQETIDQIAHLAALRGVDGNTIVEQSIGTLKLLQDNMGPKDELLIRKVDGSFQKVIFA